jgi:tetratricopeptide (TPR) repeat protein
MNGPTLPNISEAAEKVSDILRREGGGSDAVVSIQGRLSAGKSSCLRQVAERLRAQEPDAIPILLRPPAHQLDTGPATLVDFGAGIAREQDSNGSFLEWAESRRPWRERLTDARQWLEDNEDKLVLLCDDPTYWHGALFEETGFFSGRASDVTRLLVEQARCRRVIAGRMPESLSADSVVELTPDAPDREWLLDSEAWGELADAARALEETGAPLESFTALELRLAVALAALRDPYVAATAAVEEPEHRRIAAALWDVVANEPPLARLKRAWLRLSFVRRPFAPNLLGALRLDELPRRHAAVIRYCLVFGDSEEYRLHEIVRSEARAWLREQPSGSRRQLERHASRLLADYYIDRFAARASAGDPSAVSDSMESFYFVTLTAEPALRERVTPYFTEQLNALGWSLSYLHHDYDAAAEVFREAVSWDADDDYAHHYLAFNLDRQGKDAATVEGHYAAAIELNPENSWWHARYVVFLAHRGRIGDARSCWDDALVALRVAERASDRFLFETLHLWVAEALLDRGELGFAREVLDQIPDWARRSDVLAAYGPLRRRLAALTEAARNGALVPAHRLGSRWWEEGPELLQDKLGEDGDLHLVRWLAARIEDIDQDGVHLRAADLEPRQEAFPDVGRSVLDLEVFLRLCRDEERAREMRPGWHAEIGVYASRSRPDRGTTTVIRLHRPRRADWAEEPVFDSARYLRHVVPAT